MSLSYLEKYDNRHEESIFEPARIHRVLRGRDADNAP
jgi:hypothetical protein